jgi:hypothetical protein
MVRVRGVMLVEATHFVRQAHGDEAHAAVVAALAPEHQALFENGPRESAWLPIECLIAYLEQARRALAPADPDFFSRLGAHAGRSERRSSGFRPLLEDPDTTLRLGHLAWRSFYDGAELEFTLETPRRVRVRLVGLPVSRALCERHLGAWGPLLSNEEWQAHVAQLSCRALGDETCEFRVEWLPQPSGGGGG